MQKKNLKKLTIILPSRIHITLIGMNEDGYRVNGGVGFSISKPSIRLTVIENNEFIINDSRNFTFTSFEIDRIKKILEKAYKTLRFRRKIKITISGKTPTHYGFGTSTSVRIACLESLFEFNYHQCTPQKLVSLSGRGGTSGIGINTYFYGGMYFDIGKKDNNYNLKPSSTSESRINLPLVLKRVDMPNWDLGICIPSKILPKTEKEEKAFFREVCPIKKHFVYETLYHCLYGVLSSVMENDIGTFVISINELQKCKWKHEERKLHGIGLKKIENSLRKSGANAIGMSSLGPTLFFISKDIDKLLKNYYKSYSNSQVFLTKVNNTGRKLIYD